MILSSRPAVAPSSDNDSSDETSVANPRRTRL